MNKPKPITVKATVIPTPAPKPITVSVEVPRNQLDGEQYRLQQAQALLNDFERDQGRPATDIKEFETWCIAKKSTKGQK